MKTVCVRLRHTTWKTEDTLCEELKEKIRSLLVQNGLMESDIDIWIKDLER